MLLGNFSLKARLVIGFGSVIALAALLGAFALNAMSGLSMLTTKLYEHPFTVSTAILQAQANMIAMHRSMKDVVLSSDAAGLDKAVAAVDESEGKVYQSFAVVRERFLGDKTQINEALEAFRAWKPIRDGVIAFMREGKRAEAVAITREKGANQVALVSKDIAGVVAFTLDKAAKFEAAAQSQRDDAFTTMSILLAVIVLAGISIALAITVSITRPLAALRGCMGRLAEGDYGVSVPYLSNTSEVSEMAQSVGVFKGNGQKVRQLQVDQENARRQAETDKRAAMGALADDFESHINSVVDHVASASTEMNATAQSMSAVADQAQRQAAAVASAATQASSNVQTVASAAEELAASIVEIARQVGQSTKTTRQAVEKAKETNRIVGSLSEAAQKIGEGICSTRLEDRCPA